MLIFVGTIISRQRMAAAFTDLASELGMTVVARWSRPKYVFTLEELEGLEGLKYLWPGLQIIGMEMENVLRGESNGFRIWMFNGRHQSGGGTDHSAKYHVLFCLESGTLPCFAVWRRTPHTGALPWKSYAVKTARWVVDSPDPERARRLFGDALMQKIDLNPVFDVWGVNANGRWIEFVRNDLQSTCPEELSIYFGAMVSVVTTFCKAAAEL